MLKSELFASLEEVLFAEKLPEEIERAIISTYEKASDRTLARGEPIRLLLETIALIIIELRNVIDQAGKQNLLAYASDSFLDHLGALLSVYRLEATPSTTTMRFSLNSSNVLQASIIPKGTRITPDGALLFSTVEDLEIPTGELTGEVEAECLTVGEVGNGFLAGQINRLVDVFPYEISAENIDTSAGGTDVENDENLRERIQIAPESFSVAGPLGAYRFFALTSHTSIIDVSVLGPAEDDSIEPGNVFIYPLLKGGELPNEAILQTVYETCNADKIRPDTDFLHVLSPEVVAYDIAGTFWVDNANASQATYIRNAVYEAVDEWCIWQKSRLGRDINPSVLIHRIIEAGAKRVELTSPTFRALKDYEIAWCFKNQLNYGGLEDA